jgi:2-phospho-L-lactate/phosphoenolpyruvate guanylyltransferase
MTALLIPMKASASAKSRLSQTLDTDQRLQLARAMLADMVTALGEIAELTTRILLTEDDGYDGLPALQGWSIWRAGDVTSCKSDGALSSQLSGACIQLAALCQHRCLILPGDLPLITALDARTLLAEPGPEVTIVPAQRDGGTNGLLCAPPNAMPFQFGTDSARKHLAQAHTLGLTVRTLRLPSFAFDVDTPEDLSWLTRSGHSGAAARLARQWLER